MIWGGSVDAKDRFFAALVYLLPLIEAFPFGQFVLNQFPLLLFIYLPFKPLLQIYYGVPFFSFILFFVLFLAVVRNYRLSHFLRFNTMQAILIDILLILSNFILSFLTKGLGNNLLTETLTNIVFLASLVACFYSIIRSILGRDAEIPTISDAARAQVRY